MTLPKTWDPPETPVAALEIALELAREEKQWTSGDWLSFSPLYTGTPRDETKDPEFQPQCTDVQACAAGILLIALCDGQLLKRAWQAREAFSSVDYYAVLREHPIGRDSALFLARGLVEQVEDKDGEFDWGDEEVNDDPIEVIIICNDGSLAAHHDRIVSGFARAVELAKAAVVA